MVKNPPPNAGDTGDVGLIPGPGRSPGGGPTPILLPGKPHGQRSLAGCSRGVAGSAATDVTEHTLKPLSEPPASSLAAQWARPWISQGGDVLAAWA